MNKVFFHHHEVMINSANEVIAKTAREAAKYEHRLLMEQLNDLISRGLLVVEVAQPMLVTTIEVNEHQPGFEVRMESSVRLVLKDKEYIQQLEQENKKLKEKLENVKKFIDQIKTED
jgi:hypothetical protein